MIKVISGIRLVDRASNNFLRKRVGVVAEIEDLLVYSH